MSKNKWRGSYGMQFFLTLALSLIMGGSELVCWPVDDIKSLINEVLAILNNPALQAPDKRPRKVDLVEQAAARHFNYREMAKLAPGGNLGFPEPGPARRVRKEFQRPLKGLLCLPPGRIHQGRSDLSAGNPETRSRRAALIILRPNARSRQLSDAHATPRAG